MIDRPKYVVNFDHDKITHEKFYYCHLRGFPYCPVFGSIGSYQKASAVCRTMNESIGMAEPKGDKT